MTRGFGPTGQTHGRVAPPVLFDCCHSRCVATIVFEEVVDIAVPSFPRRRLFHAGASIYIPVVGGASLSSSETSEVGTAVLRSSSSDASEVVHRFLLASLAKVCLVLLSTFSPNIPSGAGAAGDGKMRWTASGKVSAAHGIARRCSGSLTKNREVPVHSYSAERL